MTGPYCEAIADPNDDEDVLPCGSPAVGTTEDGTPVCDHCAPVYAAEHGRGVALYVDGDFGAPGPQVIGFEYTVRLAISLPIAWTTLLKDVGANHYDYKCREEADHGVINGLHNTAYDGPYPSNYVIDWKDLDLLVKVLEQAPAISLTRTIRAFVLKYLHVIEHHEDKLHTHEDTRRIRRARRARSQG